MPQKLNKSAAAVLFSDDENPDVAQTDTEASLECMHTKPSNAADEQYEVIAAITGIDSSTAVNSPTDSQVTFGAPESCDESRTIVPMTAKEITWNDLQKASQLHYKFPTVICLADDDKSWEIWCGVCGSNVKVDEHGNAAGIFDGASGLYKHIVDAHVGNHANDDFVVKKFTFRKVSIRDHKAIRSGKEPSVTIGLRPPRTDKKSRSSKQTNKRSRDGAEKGEVIAGDSDSDVPTTKRKKRQSKTVGRERMVFQFEQYGQPTTTTKAPKKKNQPVKTKQLKSSSFEGPGTPDTVKNQPRGISATPKTQHIMVQHRVFPEAVRAQFGQLGDDKDDEEVLPVAKESGA